MSDGDDAGIDPKEAEHDLDRIMPEKGDRLFPIAPHPFAHAWPRSDRWAYIESYRLAAEAMIRSEEMGKRGDIVIVAVLYSYRHYIELALKEIITIAARIGWTKPPPIHHRLVDLWKLAEPQIKRTAGSDPYAQTVGSMIAEVEAIDPTGQELRYHITSSGQPSIPKLKGVDPDLLFVGMRKLRNYFQAASMMMAEHIDTEIDARAYEAELNAEYEAAIPG